MPTAIDHPRFKSATGTLQPNGRAKYIGSTTVAANTTTRIRSSRNANKDHVTTINTDGNNTSKNTKSTMIPKVFGNFRTNNMAPTTTTASSSSSSSNNNTINHKRQPTSSSPPTTNTISKTSSSGEISNTTVNGSTGWTRHYNHSSTTTMNTKDEDELNNTDDTEDSSHSGNAALSPSSPVISESSYVYPITNMNTYQPTMDSSDNNKNNIQGKNVVEDENDAVLFNINSSSSNIHTSSNASTKAVHKPVTEMLWESAEPFIAYSSEQGAKWCIGMNRLSLVWEETCSGGRYHPKQQQQQQQHDYDDTFAIVGTQDEDDEVANQSKSHHNNDAGMSSPFNIDLSNLCGTESTVPTMLSTWTTSPAPPTQLNGNKEVQKLSNGPQEAANDSNENNRSNDNQTKSRKNRTTATTATQHRIVISRTHEDIEVSPGHHVQVRLPPTNPIMKSSSSSAIANPAASPTRTIASSVVPDNQIPLTPANNTIQPQNDLPSSPQFQRSHIVKNNSSDSCKAVPLKPNDAATNPVQETLPNHEIGVTAATTTMGVTTGTVPVVSFEVRPEEALELERSISELTMRSSYAATDSALQKIPENRRMAYYAVGKHHRQSGRGGNRRCYFSGKLILGGTPFYAGSVLQGLRTLVVFCLPSSVGLPDKESLALLNLPRHPQQSLANRSDSHSTGTNTLRGLRLLKSATNGSGSKQSTPSYISHYTQHSNNLGAGASLAGSTIKSSGILSNRSSNRSLQQNQHRSNGTNNSNINSGASIAGSKSMMSRLSSLDDLSLSVEGDLDPNWSLDRDMLLKILPPASPDLLKAMSTLYPEQFETLPVQVRDAKQWKLFVKFCFFSGLPISDGEMHYKVRDDIAEQVYGEEIVLSHDVMEASTGASAEILTLPNRTVIRYLRKHYAQQCSKLDDRVFQRASWERVAPEV